MYASVNGLRLYYEIHGEIHRTGSPLVLLHGGALTIELSFGTVLPALTTHRQVIAVEMQGHGRTADIERTPSVEAFASDVVGLLDHLGVAKADVFGFSLGGLVGMQLAVEHPERVDRLVLASAHFRPDGYYPEISDPAMTSPRLPSPADFGAMRAAYSSVAPDPDGFAAFMTRLPAVVHAFAGWSPEQLRAIRSRTLIVIGDFDFVRPEHALLMQQLIPDAQLAILPGTKHAEVVARAELIVPMVERFLCRVAADH